MTDTAQKKNAVIERKKGLDAWRAAKNLFEDGLFADCLSRAYYAVFHLATAVLFTIGLEARSHQSLSKLFDQHFVKTGHFDPAVSKILRQARKLREEADYRHTLVFAKEETAEVLGRLEQCMTTLQEHLTTQGID